MSSKGCQHRARYKFSSELTASAVALYDMPGWSEAMANEGSDDAVLFRAKIVRGVSNREVNQSLRFRNRS